MAQNKARICVCVLGDVGHSPRMQYHSISLAQAGFAVDIVGYQESRPHEQLKSNPDITIHNVHAYKNITSLPRLINYLFKVIVQTICLFYTLCTIPKPSHILVQNPPSIPTLPVVWLICLIRQCYFVIDWHNYGYSILALSLGDSHLFVRIYRSLEFFFGKYSDFNFCVSESMKRDLKNRIHKKAIVLYDKPFAFFKSIDILEKHQFMLKLQSEYPEISCQTPNESLFTVYNELTGKTETKKTSPIILVSSTSWTEDEDFQILLDSLFEFDQHHAEKLITNGNSLKVVCIITGKGPMKSFYIQKLTEYSFKYTKFLFPWLTPEDYPKMLASADVGVCLHKSSSALDLPMKVVDMFGSRLPVCAYNYPSISELVLQNKNGLLFKDSANLVNALVELFQDYPTCDKLRQYRLHLESNFCKNTWHNNWQRNALPVFRK